MAFSVFFDDYLAGYYVLSVSGLAGLLPDPVGLVPYIRPLSSKWLAKTALQCQPVVYWRVNDSLLLYESMGYLVIDVFLTDSYLL